MVLSPSYLEKFYHQYIWLPGAEIFLRHFDHLKNQQLNGDIIPQTASTISDDSRNVLNRSQKNERNEVILLWFSLHPV